MKDTKANKQKLIEQLRTTPIVQVACQRVGISRMTYYRWLKSDQTFSESAYKAIDHGVGLMNDMAESQLVTGIKEKNMTAIIFWLKHHKQTYQTRVQLDGRVSLDTGELTTEQSAMVEKALKLSGMLLPEGGSNEQS